jgi:hypothetical protein
MGFYECIHDCGEGNYCVSIACSLDGFESPPSWIFCNKHKGGVNRITDYNLLNFSRRYSNMLTHKSCRANILESKTSTKGVKLQKIELLNVDLKDLGLIESKKMYFSEFDDAPSWYVEDDKVIIIDLLNEYNTYDHVDSPPYKGRDVIFDWSSNSVITFDEYKLKYPDRFDDDDAINKKQNKIIELLNETEFDNNYLEIIMNTCKRKAQKN